MAARKALASSGVVRGAEAAVSLYPSGNRRKVQNLEYCLNFCLNQHRLTVFEFISLGLDGTALSECHELALNAAHLPVGFLHGGESLFWFFASRVKVG